MKEELLLKWVISAVHERSFDPVIADQLSRLVARPPDDKAEASLASSESSGTPLADSGTVALPEEHKMYTDDEHSDSEDRLTTESNLGRLRSTRGAVAHLNSKIDKEFFGIQVTDLDEARKFKLQSRGDKNNN